VHSRLAIASSAAKHALFLQTCNISPKFHFFPNALLAFLLSSWQIALLMVIPIWRVCDNNGECVGDDFCTILKFPKQKIELRKEIE
jgi:hypothetical protein